MCCCSYGYYACAISGSHGGRPVPRVACEPPFQPRIKPVSPLTNELAAYWRCYSIARSARAPRPIMQVLETTVHPKWGCRRVDYDKGQGSATATGKTELSPIPRKISLNHSSNPECSLGHTQHQKEEKGDGPYRYNRRSFNIARWCL